MRMGMKLFILFIASLDWTGLPFARSPSSVKGNMYIHVNVYEIIIKILNKKAKVISEKTVADTSISGFYSIFYES